MAVQRTVAAVVVKTIAPQQEGRVEPGHRVELGDVVEPVDMAQTEDAVEPRHMVEPLGRVEPGHRVEVVDRVEKEDRAAPGEPDCRMAVVARMPCRQAVRRQRVKRAIAIHRQRRCPR